MKNLRIVRLQEAHLPGVMDIEARCFSTPWSSQSMRRIVHNPDVVAHVAVLGQRVVGYSMSLRVRNEAEILKLAVSEKHRRKGIGKALSSKMLAVLRGMGCKKFHLEVRGSNRAAMALYRELGFEPAGTREAYYSCPLEDAVTMVLEEG